MRALLVCAAPLPGSAELVARLATSADLVMAVDGGGSLCLEARLVPDLLVGDFDSLPQAAFDELQAAGARVVQYPAEKDQTDLELALDLARKNGVDSVTVTAASSGRLDHTLAALGALARAADMRPRLLEPELQAWILSATDRAILDLRGQGATLSLMAIGRDAVVSVSGTRWLLDHHILHCCSGLGLGNAITDERLARVTVHDGVVAVLAPQLDVSVHVTEY